MEIAKYVTNKGRVTLSSDTENGVTRYETTIEAATFSTPYYRGISKDRANKAYADAVKLITNNNV